MRVSVVAALLALLYVSQPAESVVHLPVAVILKLIETSEHFLESDMGEIVNLNTGVKFDPSTCWTSGAGPCPAGK